jgi:cytochrome P450
MAVSKGNRLPSLFSSTDEGFHANLRRSVNSAFSMSTLVQYEPFVDEVTEVFLRQTENLFASPNKICDFAEWLQFFAFDVIGQITYSKRHGFIDRGEDVDGMVRYLGKLFSYVAPVSKLHPLSTLRRRAVIRVPSPVSHQLSPDRSLCKLIPDMSQIGQMPWLDLLFLKNPLLRLLDHFGVMNFSSAVATFAKTRMDERLAEMASNKAAGIDEIGNTRADLLSMFLKAQTERPEFMTDQRVLTMAVSMAFAGSETTGISLAAVFYYLLRNSRCYHTLMHELDNAVRSGKVRDRPSCLVSWSESQTLPYLDACIKEAFRMHPAAGLPLERVTPPQGADICGKHIPGGTVVGCSAWIIHRRPEIYGEDADYYRPERWLEADKGKSKEMNANMFQFGAGSRTCIGKNISLLEIYKLVPSFLRRFEVRH